MAGSFARTWLAAPTLVVGLLVVQPAAAEAADAKGVSPARPAKASVDASSPFARLPEAVPGPETATRVPANDLKIGKAVNPRLRAALLDILSDPCLENAEVSFLATSLKSGEVLAEHNADGLINPASNAKLVTAAAALHYLKPEYRFRTEYYTRGRIKDGTLWGDLIVKGYGDPTVVTERLQRVANELYLYGIERITGSVIVDDTFFDNVLEAKGWELEEAPDRAYAAPVSALSFNYNAIAVYLRPSERDQPAIVRLDPPVEYVALQSDVGTKRYTRRLKIMSKGDKAGTLVQVTGDLGYREQPRRIYRRVYDPPRYFASALISFLSQRGVRVKHRIQSGTVPPGARLVLVDRSPPLTEIISDLNHYSNNFIAETLIKAISAEASEGERPGTFEHGLKLARAFLNEKIRVDEGDYVFGNGSGLNDVNRLSARQIVQLLASMRRDFEIGTEFMSSLAIAGTQGTIGFRMKETAAQRRLRAKTGTLRGVSALSGYVVDPRGEVIAFSLLTQNYNGAVSSVWEVQNRVGEAFASDGESFAPDGDDVVASGDALLDDPSAEPAKGGAP